MVLKDFECPKCGVTEKLVQSGVSEVMCCGVTARSLLSAPMVIGCDSFNPHYDLQLGKHFETAEEKKSYLATQGKDQLSGSLSPRKSSKSRTICTRSQYLRNKKSL